MEDLVLAVRQTAASKRPMFAAQDIPTTTLSPQLRVNFLSSNCGEESRIAKGYDWKSVSETFFDNLLSIRRGGTGMMRYIEEFTTISYLDMSSVWSWQQVWSQSVSWPPVLPLRCSSLEKDSLNILGRKLDDEEGDTLEAGVTVMDLEMGLGCNYSSNLVSDVTL